MACNFETPATVEGTAIPYGISGVAPKALLGNYNIFPSDLANARSEDILNALDAAYADGFDVANMSLGGGARGIQDLLTVAVDNLDRANMVVAVAAGNSGPGHFTVESPGSAARALTAGASSVGHTLWSLLEVGGTAYQSVKGDFGSVPAGGLSAPLAVLLDAASPWGGLSEACTPLAAGSLSGQIALLSRGTCDFSVKLANVQAAGGVGAIVANRVPGDPFVMGQNDSPTQPTIPGFMVGLEFRAELMGKNGALAKLPDQMTYIFDAAKNDIVADFTSEGPTDVDFRVKPDVMAPGVNVLSSIPVRFCGGAPCFAFFQGTSMATPHLAGSAAVLRWAYPTWGAAEIRSAVVNTAAQGVVKNPDSTLVTDVQIIGAGREDLLEAVNAMIALDPVSVSFGAVPSGSGQSQSVVVTVGNLDSTTTLNMAFNIDSVVGAGVAYSVAPAAATLAPGTSTQVTVTMSAAKGAAGGDHQARLVVSDASGELAHAAVYTFIK